MAEPNNRKRKLTAEKLLEPECQEDATKKPNINVNGPVEGVSNWDTTSTTITKDDDTPFISKSFSRFLPRNVVGTIGRKTSLLAKRTLRTGTRRGSLQTLNQGWDTISTLTSLGDDSNSQEEVTQKRKHTLSKNYTLKLRKLKEKFKTKRQLRKDRFRSLQMQTASKDRFHKEHNKSKAESNKQGTLLEKLLEEHNKHLDSL